MYKFLGIGAQKAGTTWLFKMLNQHPYISFPLGKEAHYWNRKYTKQNLESYLSAFQTNNLAEGEITPAYAFLPLETISKIHQIQPDLRIIYIIRNPVERAWSSAKMALARAEMEFDEASDQWFIDHFNSRGSLLRGDYETCLRNWRSVFNQEQILVLMFDDLKKSPDLLLSRCCSHLGVDNFNLKQLKLMDIHHQVFSTSPNQLNPNLQSYLTKLYKNKITSLSQYLNTDLSDWL